MESTSAAQGAPLTVENGVYDSDGDLILLVGPKMTRFRVCSKTLARSSPVFKRMLYGNFAESKPSVGTNWVVRLPEDVARAMAIFLSIIHGKFHVTPETLSVRDLYDLLTLTEKYDATALLRPFAHRWIDAVGSQMDDPYLLCVAWELGHIELFEKLMVVITRDCTVNDEGMLIYGRPTNELSSCTSDATAYLDPDKELEIHCSFDVNSMSQRTTHLDNSWTFPLDLILHLQPDNMIETIKRNRMVLVQEYLKPYLTLYDALARGRCTVDLGRREHLTSIEEHSACDAMAFGSLFKAFQSLGHNITLPGIAQRYNGSFTDLFTALPRIKILSHHFDCLKSFAVELREGDRRAGEKCKRLEFITPRQLRYLNKQAVKMGFPTRNPETKAEDDVMGFLTRNFDRKAEAEAPWGQARRVGQPAVPWGQGQHANSSWW
ncbi:nuclear pore protein-like protein [Colletotrichum kahawae]|uniref:Nuclear pore protein-like protein n=1 Tax=Colletotrichum kahawae TaxID=34407 RepID=A0AAE0CYP3_COLKA|nr:nuclear pore protein-like protein [Colletotrichum kahawae]